MVEQSNDSNRVMVAFPVSRDTLRGIVGDTWFRPDSAGYAANAELAATFGVETGEETEAAALQMSDVAGLAAGHAARLVIVADVPASSVTASADEPGNGAVEHTASHPVYVQDCRAFFTGRCDAATAAAARGLSLDEAWELPGVQAMLADQPLAWHDISELADWIQAGG